MTESSGPSALHVIPPKPLQRATSKGSSINQLTTVGGGGGLEKGSARDQHREGGV